MPPTRRLHLISGIEWVRHPICFKFVRLRRVNVLHVYLVVPDICDFVLFKLLRLGPINIAQVHVVPPLELLLLAICVRDRTLNVFYVQFVVVEEFVDLPLLSNLRLQHL